MRLHCPDLGSLSGDSALCAVELASGLMQVKRVDGMALLGKDSPVH